MRERTVKIGKAQVVLQPGSSMLKVIVAVLVVFSVVALVALVWVQSSLNHQISALTAEAIQISRENEKLSFQLENPDDVQTIQDIAKEELNLVTPDTVLIELN